MAYKRDEQTRHCRVPRSEGLKIGKEGESASINTLSFHSFVESQIRETDAKPGHKTSNGSHIC